MFVRFQRVFCVLAGAVCRRHDPPAAGRLMLNEPFLRHVDQEWWI
jgi:hypothetical protein